MTEPEPVPIGSTGVLVVDDQRLVREGIASLLALQPGVRVVGTAESGEAAVDLARELTPDVVLMDVRMPGMDGLTAAVALRDRTKVLMLTTFDDDEYVIRALHAGACGYLLKDLPAAELAAAVRLAHSGVDQYSARVSARLLGMLRHLPAAGGRVTAATPASSTAESGLTKRESEVLRLLATGASNREIARALFVSEGTVKNHVSSVLVRLGVRDRTQAAIYALDRGLA
ncbi:response regulator [Nocardia sp. NPDC059240]|uniref:response regulator n=1 Tax=Nocardia sp. NPDC059240 TaxID=3346786 RepID=UPI0036BF8F6C